MVSDAGAIQKPLTTQPLAVAGSYPITDSIDAASRDKGDDNLLQGIVAQQGNDQDRVQEEDRGFYGGPNNDTESASENGPPTNQVDYQRESNDDGLSGNQINNLLSNGINNNTNFQEGNGTDPIETDAPELDGKGDINSVHLPNNHLENGATDKFSYRQELAPANGKSDHLPNNQLEQGISRVKPVFHTGKYRLFPTCYF